MKKLLVLILSAILLISCSVGDDTPDFNLEVLPVESAVVPDEFTLGEIYPITVSYFRPTNCHAFKEFYYLKENNERTVAPITYVFNNDDCEPIEDALIETTFDFLVTSNGSYIFKFWQGEDANGNDQYLTIEVPVIE